MAEQDQKVVMTLILVLFSWYWDYSLWGSYIFRGPYVVADIKTGQPRSYSKAHVRS